MEKNLIETLVKLIEARATQKDAAKAIYLESVLLNVLESSRTPKEVVQSWIDNLNASK